MTTRMVRRWFSGILLATLLTAFGGQVWAATTPEGAAKTALAWLNTRQQADGSFPGFDAGANADAIFALAASGIDPNKVQRGGVSPVAFLETQAGTYGTKGAATAGKTVLAAIAAGKDPRSFGGQNLIEVIGKSLDAATGRYGTQTTDHAYALLALAAAGEAVPSSAVDATAALQLPDGGWSYDGAAATGSDTNTTALVIQALKAAKAGDAQIAKAVDYLKSQQNADGGFPYSQTSQYGNASDANSTAVTIQGLLAAGIDPRSLIKGGNDPLAALMTFQNASGAFRYQQTAPDDNDLATAQAIPALLLKTFPLASAAGASAPAPATLPTTGGEPIPAWVLVPAFVLVVAGAALRFRRT